MTGPHTVGADSSPTQAQRPAGLLQKLIAVVRPEFRSDVLVFDPHDPVFGGPACAVPGCIRTARGRGLCSAHHLRWRHDGRPDLDRFTATTAPRIAGKFGVGSAADAVPAFECRVDVAVLAPQLRLEVQYLLQCRRDEQPARTPVTTVARMVRLLAGLPVVSLLDWDEPAWRTSFGRPAPKDNGPRALVIYGFRKLEDLAEERGWEVEYPRDVWRLRRLDKRTGDGSPSQLRFDHIPQPWLKELAKRWVRWRLGAGLGTTAAGRCVTAITRFAQFLAAGQVGVDRLADVDRAVLERYLAHLHTEFAGRPVHRNQIGVLNAFLTAIRQHGWDPSLPAAATFYPEDFPKDGEHLPRALAEHVMAQVEHASNLERWDNPAYRLTTLILIRCGLRVSDALRLPFDCVAADADGAPYLRYYNHKMNREALVPIDEELQQLIGEQQQRALERWPDGVPVLFPRPLANSDGHNPVGATTYRGALDRWLREPMRHPRRTRPARASHSPPVEALAGHHLDQPGRAPGGRSQDLGPRLARHDSALRPTVRHHDPAALGTGPQGQHERADGNPRPGRAAGRGVLGKAADLPRHPGTAQRLLRTPPGQDLPTRERLPDLPNVPHHRRVPAPAPATPPASPAAHHRGRGPRPSPHGGDEPPGRRQPREDHHRSRGRRPGAGGDH